MKREFFGLKVSEQKKKKLEERAEAEDKTLSRIGEEAIDLFLSFPPRFLEELKAEADKYKISVGTYAIHLLCAFTAMTAALQSEGMKTPVFGYAFRITENGLLNPNETGVLTFQEVQSKIQEIKRKANSAKRAGRPVVLDEVEKGLLTYSL